MFIFSSCNDELDQLDEEVENKIEKETIVDGRMKFTSSETLKSRIEDLKSQPENVLIDELENLNNSGFTSFRPVVTESNLESVQQRYGVMTNGRSIEDAQEVTDYIGDDVFAAILNEEGLLQVGDSVYKYTPIGLFFVHENKLDHLNEFLDELIGDQSNARSVSTIDPCPVLASYNIQGGEVTSLDSDVNYYSDIDPCSGGGGGGSPTPSPTPSPSPSDPIEDFVNSLEPCTTNSGWANWLFGDSRICIDKFTDRSRVRTKFWNQNYYLWRSVGIKVKHQFRQFGIWYNSSIDEMRLGIKSAYHLYDLKQEDLWDKPTVTTKRLIYNNNLYNFTPSPQLISPAVETATLPDGIDINIIYDYPAGVGDNRTSEEYINNNIYPEVVNRLINFYPAYNINPADIGGILITVIGDTKIGYKRINDFKNATNESKLEVLLDNDQPNFQVGIKASGGIVKPDYKKFKFKAKNSFFDASIEAYGVGRRSTSVKGSLLIATELNP
ncbi:MAG: hypothetical protein ACQETL_10330 [Bacteroidota bacterium]